MKMKNLLRPAKIGIVVLLGLVVCTFAACSKSDDDIFIIDEFNPLLVKTRGIELTSSGSEIIYTLEGTIPPSGVSFTVIPEDDIMYRKNATISDISLYRIDGGKATYPSFWDVTNPFNIYNDDTEIKEFTADWGSVVRNADGEMLNSIDVNINRNDLGFKRKFTLVFVGIIPLVRLDIVLIQDPIELSE